MQSRRQQRQSRRNRGRCEGRSSFRRGRRLRPSPCGVLVCDLFAPPNGLCSSTARWSQCPTLTLKSLEGRGLGCVWQQQTLMRYKSSHLLPDLKILSSLIKFIKIILMLPWLICANVYNSLANNSGFMKLTSIILKQPKPNFQNVYYCLRNNDDSRKLASIILKNVWNSLGKNDSFCKNDENTLCFKGN